jgi:hypothetical protein
MHLIALSVVSFFIIIRMVPTPSDCQKLTQLWGFYRPFAKITAIWGLGRSRQFSGSFLCYCNPIRAPDGNHGILDQKTKKILIKTIP